MDYELFGDLCYEEVDQSWTGSAPLSLFAAFGAARYEAEAGQPRGEGLLPLTVRDPSGRRVRTLVGATLPAGSHRLVWDARTDAGHSASSGVYYLRMVAGGATRSRRTVLIR